MATLKKLVKTFPFWDYKRSDITFSDTDLIEVSGNVLKLKPVKNPQRIYEFSTAADIRATTRVTTPTKSRNWLLIEVNATLPKDVDNNQVTSYQLRFTDGTNDYYFNGANWVIAGVSDWNDLATVNANLATLVTDIPATRNSFGVVINLVTTDGLYTPYVSCINVLYEADIVSYLEEIIIEAVMTNWESLRFFGDIAAESDGLNPYVIPELEGQENIVGIDGVWNDTTDPDHLTDLFTSYNPVTRGVTLTSPVPSGEVIWIRAIMKPTVAIRTSSDYIELNSVPSIHVSDLTTLGGFERLPVTAVIDRSLPIPQGTVLPKLRQSTFRFSLVVSAGLLVDWARLTEAYNTWLEDNKLFRIPATDEFVTTWGTKLDSLSAPMINDIHSTELIFELRDVPWFIGTAITAGDPANPGIGYGVNQLDLGFDLGEGSPEENVTVTD